MTASNAFVLTQLQLVGKPEVEGRIHEGFYWALFYSSNAVSNPNFTVTERTMFQRICEVLDEKTGHGEKPLYITGHSLGESRSLRCNDEISQQQCMQK